jgi:hypothetical protein
MNRQTSFICRPSNSSPPAGYEVVPTPEAKQLAAGRQGRWNTVVLPVSE